MLVPIVILSTGIIVLGAQGAKPGGFLAMAAGVLAILSVAIHWPR
jgi:hypothetical protein